MLYEDVQQTANESIWQPLDDKVVKSAGRTLQILEFFDDARCEANGDCQDFRV